MRQGGLRPKSFKVLTYRWDNKQTLVVSEGADAIRTMASQAMFDSVIDPRYALLKSGEAGNETYVAVFAAQDQGGSYGDMSQALQDRVGAVANCGAQGAGDKDCHALC